MSLEHDSPRSKITGKKPRILTGHHHFAWNKNRGKKLNKKVLENGSMQTNLVPDIRKVHLFVIYL